ncbi:MAG: hypothetical protein KJO88_06405, partial [Gammaproteobacteria bacterium]|nr:hypothetical protein [Gammaproteobacteria bacterium]
IVYIVSGLIALSFIFIDTYIQSDFYATPNVLEKEKADALYKKANTLSVIRPRSLALARYKFLYKLNKPQSQVLLQDLHESLEKIFRLNRNDSYATHFLARFAQSSPDIYKKLQTEYVKSGFYEQPINLFYRSMQDNPSLLPNYYQLRLIYIAQNEREKAYRLFTDKLLPRFDFGEISMPEQVPVIIRMLEDAEELGLVNDVVKYASILLYIDSCHENALSAIGAERSKQCTNRTR